jgi:TPP-dependent pyruvate/acetoin dehydrogenase alpha subunit
LGVEPTRVVAIGASAGGLVSLEQLFAMVPEESGMAFVVIQHLSPEYPSLMDELLGRATGVCGGRAGSMNVIDPEHGLLGCYGIVGGSIAAATGAALALRDTGNVAVAFFGDGAVNQAYFYECLNFAKVFSLPALYVCENNVYGEYTRSEDVTAGTAMSRVEAMELPAQFVDGNDLWAVRDAAGAALENVRAGKGPAFIEAFTYRFVGHSRSDPGKYRPEGELDSWRERDPLLVARTRLEAFDKALEDSAAAEQPKLRFDVIGPLPPTAFASAVVEA